MTLPMEDADVPRFYLSSIHERRLAAYVCRAFPLGLYLLFIVVFIHSALRFEWLLLFMCAGLNICVWIFASSLAIFAIAGVRMSQLAQEAANAEGLLRQKAVGLSEEAQPQYPLTLDLDGPATAWSRGALAVAGSTSAASRAVRNTGVHHLIVLPNFQEEEEMLSQTLEALSQAVGSEDFRIVLAVEEREGPRAQDKARHLKNRFASRFARILISKHPDNLVERHIDGSADAELPGKASNLKWAVSWASQELRRKEPGLDLSSALLTVADADCIFHPSYFGHVRSDYCQLQQQGDGQHFWSMWQAPQLAYRHYYATSPISRVMAYMNSIYEFGGVSSLLVGGYTPFTYKPYTAYTMPLQLALNAGAWEGDVVAEDHHCFLKCFFYSLYASVNLASTSPSALEGQGHVGTVPSKCQLKVRPVFLPIKSTSIGTGESYAQAHAEAWQRARRRAQGVAELSYSMLAAFDFLRSMPRKHLSFELCTRVAKVAVLPMFNRIVPICQTTALGLLSLRWFLHGRVLDNCPAGLGFWQLGTKHAFLCDFAGARVSLLPAMVPLSLVIVAIYLSLFVTFLRPAEKRLAGPSRWTVWDAEDGNIPRSSSGDSYSHQNLLGLLVLDCSVLMWPLLIPYGVVVEFVSYVTVCLWGNRIKYTAAAAPLKNPLGSYGTLSAFGPPQCWNRLRL